MNTKYFDRINGTLSDVQFNSIMPSKKTNEIPTFGELDLPTCTLSNLISPIVREIPLTNPEKLRELLSTKALTITFETADYRTRVMTVTQDQGFISLMVKPLVNKSALKEAVQASKHVIEDPLLFKVWSITSNNWRSIRYDRIKRVEYSII